MCYRLNPVLPCRLVVLGRGCAGRYNYEVDKERSVAVRTMRKRGNYGTLTLGSMCSGKSLWGQLTKYTIGTWSTMAVQPRVGRLVGLAMNNKVWVDLTGSSVLGNQGEPQP